jgi:type I thyroxine 5'-deiodinase
VRLNEIFERYEDDVNFFCIYIKEAHPEDEWQVPHNLEDDVVFAQPKTIEERGVIAEACMLKLELKMPTLLDDMNDTTDAAYAAQPERLYVIDTDGNVSYQSGMGPWGFDVASWEKAIEAQLD